VKASTTSIKNGEQIEERQQLEKKFQMSEQEQDTKVERGSKYVARGIVLKETWGKICCNKKI